MRIILLLLLFFSSLCLGAQEVTEYYPDGGLMKKGQTKIVKFKSKVAGIMVFKIKKGEWLHYYPNGQLALKENFKIIKKESLPDGTWEYYSPEGQLLKTEIYKKGIPQSQKYYSEGQFTYMSDSFNVEHFGDSSYLITLNIRGRLFYDTVPSGKDNMLKTKAKIWDDNPLPAADPFKIDVEATEDDPGFWLSESENLVANYSFEHSKRMPDDEILGVADTFIDSWYMAAGTPDYFRSNRYARTGKKLTGIRIFSYYEYLEYLENELVRPLEKGEKYCTRVHFRLRDNAELATDAIGFRFDDHKISFLYNTHNLPVPQIINKPRQFLTQQNHWMQLTGLYTAQGGERYLTIGGFKTMKTQNVVRMGAGSEGQAYYLIDDIYVWRVEKDEDCPCNMEAYNQKDSFVEVKKEEKIDTFAVGKKFVIKNIFFDTDKDELLPASFDALDSLVQVLGEYPTMEIEISGHTDNQGTKERNRVLSRQRALAVLEYLKESGIDETRLSYEGYADTQPIDTNTTPEGRQNNRRVEFKVLRK